MLELREKLQSPQEEIQSELTHDSQSSDSHKKELERGGYLHLLLVWHQAPANPHVLSMENASVG